MVNSTVKRRSFDARAHGFTLLEVLVGLTINAIVLTAVIGVFSLALNEQRLERARAQLGREGAALGLQLTAEIRLAGLGRPLAPTVSGVGDVPLHMLIAQKESIGFIADLPRPDANFSTFGVLNDRPAGVNHIMWHTDNNGICAPQLGVSCDTATTSALYPGEGGCNSAGAALDRTCAWGGKRLRGGDALQIIAGNGSFLSTTVPAALTLEASVATDGGGVLALKLDPTFPATWPNDTLGDAPVDIRGQGWVATMDRVFFRYAAAARELQRRQCWGAFNIQDASWPRRSIATNAATASTLDFAAVPGSECTDWEVVARDVQRVDFQYFRAAPPPATLVQFPSTDTQRELVARVQWTIRLQRTINNRLVTHDVVGSVRLRNI